MSERNESEKEAQEKNETTKKNKEIRNNFKHKRGNEYEVKEKRKNEVQGTQNPESRRVLNLITINHAYPCVNWIKCNTLGIWGWSGAES